MNFSGRKRRQTPTDFCEPRFVFDASTLILVWACPSGGLPPGDAAQVFLCEVLLNNSLVTSCTYPDGTMDTIPTPNPLEPIEYVGHKL